MTDKRTRLVLGALTGLVGLLAMIRLVSGAFGGTLATFAWVFTLLAMVPWVGYVAWRAGHGQLAGRSRLAVLILGVAGVLAVWLLTVGAVLALACSLAGFVVIWVNDWPPRRLGAEDFVRIEDLTSEEPDQ